MHVGLSCCNEPVSLGLARQGPVWSNLVAEDDRHPTASRRTQRRAERDNEESGTRQRGNVKREDSVKTDAKNGRRVSEDSVKTDATEERKTEDRSRERSKIS